jgi:hypothetical protein
MTGHSTDDECAADRSGQRRGREHHAAAEVDPSLPRVSDRAACSVEEHCRQADRGQRLRRVVRVEQQQDWRQDEAAAGADQGPEGAHADADQAKHDRRLERPAHDLDTIRVRAAATLRSQLLESTGTGC